MRASVERRIQEDRRKREINILKNIIAGLIVLLMIAGWVIAIQHREIREQRYASEHNCSWQWVGSQHICK